MREQHLVPRAPWLHRMSGIISGRVFSPLPVPGTPRAFELPRRARPKEAGTDQPSAQQRAQVCCTTSTDGYQRLPLSLRRCGGKGIKCWPPSGRTVSPPHQGRTGRVALVFEGDTILPPVPPTVTRPRAPPPGSGWCVAQLFSFVLLTFCPHVRTGHGQNCTGRQVGPRGPRPAPTLHPHQLLFSPALC